MAINFDKFKPKNDTQRLVMGLYEIVKGFDDKFVTKDAIPVSYSPSTGHYSNAMPNTGQMNQGASYTNSVVQWPAPSQFATGHGKEAAKKAWVEYINAANQYQQEEGPERKLELAGRMNTDITSIIQGIQLGTEAAEEVQKRIRSGDQAAVLEKETNKDVLSKLLKLLWVHNTAARSGKNAGLEFKPMDGQLTGRLNRATQLACADDGMSLEAGEDPDAIFASEYNPMPTPEQQQQAQEQAAGAAGAPADNTMPEMEGEQMEAQENPAEEQAPVEDVAEEQAPQEEQPQTEEQTPQDQLQQQAMEEEVPVEEAQTPDEQQAQEQGTMENLVGEENLPEEQAVEEIPQEEEQPLEEETAPEDEEDAEAQEEINEAQESATEADAERAEADEAQAEADEQEAEAQTAEDQAGEESKEAGEETGEALVGEEPPEETEEEVIEDEEDEEEPVYCIECDREVDEEDIANCENPNCPFREKEDEPEEEVPVEEAQKHFVFLTREDHSDCRAADFTVKEFDGIKGQYCHDHSVPVHYEFDQNIWTAKDAHKWVTKNTKEYKLKTKSASEIVYDTLENVPDSVIKQWIKEERERKETPTEKIEIEEKSIDEFDLDESQIDSALSQVFEAQLKELDKKFKRYGV